MLSAEPCECPPSPWIVIQAHSRRQAMDWSLVLASQGIEATIHHEPSTDAWELLVPVATYDHALDSIRRYRLENRRWNWRREVSPGGLTWHGGALLWLAGLLGVEVLGQALSVDVTARAAASSQALAHGEWWRMFTATWLHADVGHLASNASIGLLLLGLAMASYGGALTLLITFLAGACGNLIGYWFHPHPFTALGASGAVMGALGLLAARSVSYLRRSSRAGRAVLGGLAGGGFLFLLLGANPAADVLAHAVGFVFGAVTGAVLGLCPAGWASRAWVRYGLGILYATLVLLTWGLALR